MTRVAGVSAATCGSSGVWMGQFTNEPGFRSGAHHHGDVESAIYVVSGRLRMRWGERLEHEAEAAAGDFIFVPARLVHQEINASDERRRRGDPCSRRTGERRRERRDGGSSAAAEGSPRRRTTMPITRENGEIRATPPFTDDDVAQLRVGDHVRFYGTIYTARDAAHRRMIAALNEGKPLPIDVKGQVIYYVGPSPARPGRVIGSAGPTTAMRLDPFTPALLDQGLKVIIGKGGRGSVVKKSLQDHKAVYLLRHRRRRRAALEDDQEAGGRRVRGPRHGIDQEARGRRLPGDRLLRHVRRRPAARRARSSTAIRRRSARTSRCRRPRRRARRCRRN